MRYIIQRIAFGLLTVLLFCSSFLFSSQSGGASGHLSKGILADIVENSGYFNDLSYTEKADIIKNSDLYIRKAAHFTEYAVMAFTIFMFISSWRMRRKFLPYAITLGLCLTAAASDELHQAFSAGRTPALLDVGIDFGGALLMCLIILCISKIISHHIKKRNARAAYRK